MPYGSKTDMTKIPQQWRRVNLTGEGPQSVSRSLSLLGNTWSRSGTNRNVSIRQKFQKARSYTYQLKRVIIPFYYTRKYRDLSGRWRRERIAIPVVRLKRTRVPIERPKRKNSLLVNDLTYTSSKLTSTKGADIAIVTRGTNYGPTYPKWYINGETWYLGNSWPAGLGGSGSPSVYHPDSYGASWLSTDFASDVAALQAKSLGKIYEKAKAQNVNLANFLAEIGKTKDSFVEIVRRIASVALAAKKGRFKQAWQKLLPQGVSSKQLANDHLLWTYGIAPLLGDIDGMAKQLAEGFKDGESIVVKSANEIQRKSQTSGTVSSPLLRRRETLQLETTITVRSVLRYKLSNPALQNLSQLGLTNPATVAWELTPWSFVIDWIIPIGGWLDTLDTWLMLQPVSYHETTVIKQKVICVAVHTGSVGSSGNECDTFGGTTYWEKENVYVSRQTKSLPRPPFPVVKNPVSGAHLANALALLRQIH